MSQQTTMATMTTQEIANRFNELAKQEKWFEIQEALFAENVKSIDPPGSSWFGYAEGKAAVRQKGESFVKKIESVHSAHTTEPIVAANHFAVSRKMDLTLQELGRIQIDELMLYEVQDGEIVSEQFFY